MHNSRFDMQAVITPSMVSAAYMQEYAQPTPHSGPRLLHHIVAKPSDTSEPANQPLLSICPPGKHAVQLPIEASHRSHVVMHLSLIRGTKHAVFQAGIQVILFESYTLRFIARLRQHIYANLFLTFCDSSTYISTCVNKRQRQDSNLRGQNPMA